MKENKNTKLKRLLKARRVNEKLIAQIRAQNYLLTKEINKLLD